MENVFNFFSQHDTVNRTMTAAIEPFQVIVDWNNMTIKTFKGEKLIELLSFEKGNFTLDNLEQTLRAVEQSAIDLKNFSHV